MSRSIGIDLGTTNSCAAYINQNTIQAEVLVSREGGRTTPSVVAYTETDVLVGKPAVDQEAMNASNTIRSVKRHMGTNWRSSFGNTSYSPEQISAEILKKIKSDAEAYLGEPVTQAVITVPAYFDHNQRQATVTAGELAGLEVLRIINEPTAAALAYGLGNMENQTILVFDLGGGTFDVTILKISSTGVFQVVSTSGDTHLGGDDFDQILESMIYEDFKRQNRQFEGISLDLDAEGHARLREAAEQAKKDLSAGVVANVNIPYFLFDNGKPVHLRASISRSEFENGIKPLIERARKCVIQAMKDADMGTADIDEVIFVGGSTRVPYVAKSVESWLGKTPNRSVNPDEAVGLGAAVQAGILSKEYTGQRVVLVDVTPLTLGVETLNDVFCRMIKRNTTVPCEFTDVFSTAEDDQKRVDVRVYQGERPRASLNRFLGEFHLEGLPPAPRGVPQIEVKFRINSNGILSVTARDRVTEVEQTVTMTGSSSLTSDEITNMIADATAHESEDAQFEETVQAQDNLRSKLFQIESLLREYRDLFSEELIENLEDSKLSLEDILSGTASLEAMISMSQVVTVTIKEADKIAQEVVAKEVEEAKKAEPNPSATTK